MAARNRLVDSQFADRQNLRCRDVGRPCGPRSLQCWLGAMIRRSMEPVNFELGRDR